MTITDNMLLDRIDRAIAARLEKLFSGDVATVATATGQTNGRDVETIATVSDAVQPQRKRRARRQAPAVGYHLNVDKRTAKKALDVLSHNPGAVLSAIIAKPGQTNRELTETLADEVPAGKKAIESALDMLRTIDADGNKLERGSLKQKRHALVVSREL